jgi:hypothetical protein
VFFHLSKEPLYNNRYKKSKNNVDTRNEQSHQDDATDGSHIRGRTSDTYLVRTSSTFYTYHLEIRKPDHAYSYVFSVHLKILSLLNLRRKILYIFQSESFPGFSSPREDDIIS